MVSSRNKRKTLGFTLIELLIAVAVISILTGIGLTSLNRANQTSRDAQRRSDIETIRGALEEYYADANHNEYPGGLGALVSRYMKAVPDDPNPSQSYLYSGGGQTYCVGANLDVGPDPDYANSCGLGSDYEKSQRD